MAQTSLKSIFAVAAIIGSLLLPASKITANAPPVSEFSTLESYLQRAQAANPELQAFEKQYQAAMQRIPQATALPNPMFEISNFVKFIEMRAGPHNNVLSLRQEIPWFGKRRSRGDEATAEADALRFAYQNQQLTLARTVALAFFEYGYTEEMMRLTATSRDLLRELEPIVEGKVRSGGEINALLRLKVEVGITDDRLQSLTQQRVVQSARLGELLALPEPTLLPWPEWQPPEAISPDGVLLTEAIQIHHPELQMLEQMIESATVRRRIARLESFPDVTVGIHYLQSGRNMGPGDRQDAWSATVGFTLPIWFTKNKAARAEADFSQDAAKSDYASRLNGLRSELSTSLARLSDANRRLQLYGEELLDLAEQAVANTRASYESGRTGILEVIDSERSLLDLQLLYWRAASDAWQQRIILQTLANHPLSDISTLENR